MIGTVNFRADRVVSHGLFTFATVKIKVRPAKDELDPARGKDIDEENRNRVIRDFLLRHSVVFIFN